MTTNTAGSETVSAVLRALRERLEIAEDFPDDVLDEAAASAEAGPAGLAPADRRENPLVTIASIIATGNHYVVDAVAAVAYFLIACALVAIAGLLRNVRLDRPKS